MRLRVGYIPYTHQSLKALKMAEKMRALRPCLLSSSLDHQFLEGRNYI